jgi:hypothetical protein
MNLWVYREDILRPLQGLCLRDTGIAKLLFNLLFRSLYLTEKEDERTTTMGSVERVLG